MTAMPGQTIPLFDRREFDFSNLQGATTLIETIIKELDVSQWTEATLMVRIHDNSCTNTATTVTVMLAPTLPSPDEPSGTYVADNVASVAINSATTASLELDGATANFGSYLTCAVMGTQDPTSPQTVKATLSAELSVKC